MSSRSEVEIFALRSARDYAAAHGLKLVSAFDDTLSGDVARLAMLRRLRRSFPDVPRVALDQLIEELLAP
jgi:hypothetical protein